MYARHWRLDVPMAAANDLLTSNALWLAGAVVALIFVLVFLAVFARFARLWILSVMTGAGVRILDLVRMWLRKVNPTVIVRSKIMAVQAGLDENEEISTRALEAHYLAGGNLPLVIRSMIAARKAKIIELSFKRATAIDLAGRNILEAVQTSVYPRVIDCPPNDAKRPTLDAVAKNGIQLKVKARVTVRANLDQLVGGADRGDHRRPRGRGHRQRHRLGRDARRGAGQSQPHFPRGAGPQARLANGVRNRVDRHRRHRRGRQHRRPPAGRSGRGRHARGPRPGREPAGDGRLAGAREHCGDREKPRLLVEAEAEVPKAIAEAFRTNKLGILDYYRLKNVQADTEMREAIAGTGTIRAQ